MSRPSADRIGDILAAIARIESYRSALGTEDPVASAMAYDAVLRNLGVIGEAVRALPAELKEVHPGVPWAAIAGLRNIVIHEYFRVDRDVILDIIDNNLPALADALTDLLD